MLKPLKLNQMAGTITVIFMLVIALLLFLLGRDLICWYFKINERIKLREETNQLLRKIINNQTKE